MSARQPRASHLHSHTPGAVTGVDKLRLRVITDGVDSVRVGFTALSLLAAHLATLPAEAGGALTMR